MAIEEYASVRATPELVGRKDILQKIYDAIKEESTTPHVFYITAPGGLGKTRLVDEVLKKLNGKMAGEWAASDILPASRLVDLYHTYTHSEEGLIADIVEVLDDEQGSRFVNYLSQRVELDRVKYDLSEIMQAVFQQRERMMKAFVDDFNEVGKMFDKTVLAFDTVENLTYLADRVQMALGLSGKSIGVAGWLVYDFLPNIQNTVVLIAGRPETPQLKIELEKLYARGEIIFTPIELGKLSEEETLDYFDAIMEITREENPKTANRLETIKEETKRVVYYLSDGQPFLLSLFVDYLAIAEELFHGVREPLDEIKKKSASANGLQIEQKEFRDAILQEFQRIRRPFDDVIQALSWTRKGMGAELLAWILKRGEPSEEEIADAKGYIQTLRDPDLRLSFVKIRDIDRLVFLQDEMYKLMQSLHQRGRLRHRVRRTYELITKFYEKRIEAQASLVSSLQKETNALLSSGSWKEITESQKAQITVEQQNLREARARLQSYQVEHVYYCLQVGYIKGIQAYYRLAEAAFQSNDTNLWLLLRDELLKFAEPLRSNENEREALKYIDGDIGVRWIKTNIASGQYDRALQQIERFRITPSDLLKEGSFAELSLRIFKSWALIYSGKEYEQAKSILESVFASLNKLADEFEPEFDKWRLKLLRAYAQDILGYMYRSQGNFAKAAGYFQDNIRLWQELRVESELAKELDDLSWSLAETGDFQSAFLHCEDGLNLRRRLGHRYQIALSLNTLGLIETRRGQPERARFRCEQALGIFRDLEQPRGIGLACTALAESLRRMTNIPDLLNEEQALKNLVLAEGYAKEAVEIFTKTVQERLRFFEANIELGCVYREMARLNKDDKKTVRVLVAKGKDAFDAVIKNAEGEFTYRGVDALVNQAWMYYYIDNFEEPQRLVDQALGMMDPQYLFTGERGPLHGDQLVPWYWVQLGKAYLLLGKIAFDNYALARTNSNKMEMEKQLNVVAQQWTLSLAYDAQYGKNFRDVVGARKVMYNCLYKLNQREWTWVREGIKIVDREYPDHEALRLFEEFINQRF